MTTALWFHNWLPGWPIEYLSYIQREKKKKKERQTPKSEHALVKTDWSGKIAQTQQMTHNQGGIRGKGGRGCSKQKEVSELPYGLLTGKMRKIQLTIWVRAINSTKHTHTNTHTLFTFLALIMIHDLTQQMHVNPWGSRNVATIRKWNAYFTILSNI